MNRKWSMLILRLLTSMLLISACSQQKDVPLEVGEDGRVKLKIMAYHTETFMRTYGTYLTMQFPDVDIELITTEQLRSAEAEGDVEEALIKFIDQHNPDLILMKPDQVVTLADKGKLQQLDEMMKLTNFDSSGIPSNMMDYFRQKGNGTLYAIAPTYYNQAIYYNADMFKQYIIELPRDQMTWEEVFELGARFGQISTEETPMYGIQDTMLPDPLISLMNVAHTMQLRILDSRGEQVQINTDGWRQVYQLVSEAIKSRSVYTTEKEVKMVTFGDTPFSRGEVAMQVDYPATSSSIRGNAKFEVGVVTMPIVSSNPEESPFYSFYDMYAVHAASKNKRLAWDVLEYMISPTVANARIKSFGPGSGLPIRNAELQQIGEWDAKPFKMLVPSLDSGVVGENLLPETLSAEVKQSIFDAMKVSLDDIANNGTPVDTVLAALQEELQAKVNQELGK